MKNLSDCIGDLMILEADIAMYEHGRKFIGIKKATGKIFMLMAVDEHRNRSLATDGVDGVTIDDVGDCSEIVNIQIFLENKLKWISARMSKISFLKV